MLFNMVGWAWKKTRKWHAVTIGLTALSWFGFGFWYGWGYCICTDWHWQVRRELGYIDPNSYTQVLVIELTGWDPGAFWADAVTVGVFGIVLVLSVVLNARDRKRLTTKYTK